MQKEGALMRAEDLHTSVQREIARATRGPLEYLLKTEHGRECYVVGGFVRNLALGLKTERTDVDLFVHAQHEGALVDSMRDLGKLARGPFGAWRWTPEDSNEYVDVVLIEDFRNGLEPCKTIHDCLSQFDVTANSIAVQFGSGQIINHQYFWTDLVSHVIRAVRLDYPDEVFSVATSLTRNAVLWFRICSLAVRLSFKIEPVTEEWVQANRRYERLRDEYLRVFGLN
jgi:hypothetical protein